MERIKEALEKARRVRRAELAPALAGDGGALGVALAEPQARTRIPPARVAELQSTHLATNRVVAMDPLHPSRWAFDLLRTLVLQRMNENGWKTLAVTSPTVNSGKTVLAINLAISIANHPNHSATLVDFDLRRPRVASYLGLQGGPALEDVLAGTASVKDAAVGIGLPKLSVLPTLKTVTGASEVLSSPRTAQLIADLRAADPNGIIIFDLPPVTAVDDVITVLPRIDCVLLVIGNGMSTRREIQEALRHLSRFNVVGSVLNKAAAPVRDAGYY